LRLPLFNNARDQYQHSGYGECWCNELEMAEKLLDLGVG